MACADRILTVGKLGGAKLRHPKTANHVAAARRSPTRATSANRKLGQPLACDRSDPTVPCALTIAARITEPDADMMCPPATGSR